MYTVNSSILYGKDKNSPDTGHLTSILNECFWPPLFQTNWISRRINKLFENPTSLSIFTLNIKQFLWKYHILPTLFWAVLILLKTAPQKVSFCFKCPDTGTVRILGNILYSTTNGPGKCVSAENFNKNNKNSDISLSTLIGVQNKPLFSCWQSTGIEK